MLRSILKKEGRKLEASAFSTLSENFPVCQYYAVFHSISVEILIATCFLVSWAIVFLFLHCKFEVNYFSIIRLNYYLKICIDIIGCSYELSVMKKF